MRRISNNYAIVGDIMSNYTTGSNYYIISNCYVSYDNNVCPYVDIIANYRN